MKGIRSKLISKISVVDILVMFKYAVLAARNERREMTKDNAMKVMYAAQTKWFNNRASAIFPLYINEINNQVIVFQHYWNWKMKSRMLSWLFA